MSAVILWPGEGSPQDDALTALACSFSWLSGLFDDRHAELVDKLFDLPSGDAKRIEEMCSADPVFSAWLKFSATWKRFSAKWQTTFNLGEFNDRGEFAPSQEMPSALPELCEVIECFNYFSGVISAAVPAFEAFEAAQREVFAGRARRDDGYSYGAIVMLPQRPGGAA